MSNNHQLEAPASKEKSKMNRTKTFLIASAMTASMAVGGVTGAVLLGPLVASAADPTPAASGSATTPSGSTTAAPGKFTPNEDAAHEAAESPEREAQEDAGVMPTVR
jgi:hypothetical protein